jgi:hypothetical protein
VFRLCENTIKFYWRYSAPLHSPRPWYYISISYYGTRVQGKVVMAERLRLSSSNRLTVNITRNKQRNRRTLNKNHITSPSISLRPYSVWLLPLLDRPGPTGHFRWILYNRHLQCEWELMEGSSRKGYSRLLLQLQLPHASILTGEFCRPA